MESSSILSAFQLTVTDLRGEHYFSSANIICMKAANKYTVFYFILQRPFIASKVLKVYEKLLQFYGFLHTYRSHLVNLQFVESVEQRQVIMYYTSVVELAK